MKPDDPKVSDLKAFLLENNELECLKTLNELIRLANRDIHVIPLEWNNKADSVSASGYHARKQGGQWQGNVPPYFFPKASSFKKAAEKEYERKILSAVFLAQNPDVTKEYAVDEDSEEYTENRKFKLT